MVTQELTEAIESLILSQLREGEKYAHELALPGLNNPYDPWHSEAKRRLCEQLESEKKIHRTWHRRIPGRWRIGPGPQA